MNAVGGAGLGCSTVVLWLRQARDSSKSARVRAGFFGGLDAHPNHAAVRASQAPVSASVAIRCRDILGMHIRLGCGSLRLSLTPGRCNMLSLQLSGNLPSGGCGAERGLKGVPC